MLALVIWLWLLVKALPAADFGWLSSLLAVIAICALLAQAGIPYLFFSDEHTGSQLGQHWRETLGAILITALPLAALGFSALPPASDNAPPSWAIVAFMALEIAFSSIVQAIALRGHAIGRVGFAAALPALQTASRVVATAVVTSPLIQTNSFLLPIYLALHATFASAVVTYSLYGPGKRLGLKFNPAVPKLPTLKHAWRYAAMGGSSLVMGELDKPVAARVLGLSASGHYALAYRVSSTLATPATALAASMIPRWTNMAMRGQSAEMIRTYLGACSGVAVAGLILTLMLKTGSTILSQLTLGLPPEVWPWIERLAWLIPLLGLHQITSAGLLAAGKPISRTVIDLLAFLILLLTFFLLLPDSGTAALSLSCIVAELCAIVIGSCIFINAAKKKYAVKEASLTWTQK